MYALTISKEKQKQIIKIASAMCRNKKGSILQAGQLMDLPWQC